MEQNEAGTISARTGATQGTGASVAAESRWVMVALFVIAASTLIVEIGLTKFLAYKVFYHYSYAVISMVIFSFGAAGAVLYVYGLDKRTDASGGPWQWVARTVSWYPVWLIGSILLFSYIPLDPYNMSLPAWLRVLSLPIYFSLFAVPFFFAGLAISCTLAASKKKVTTVYFWDLLGAGIGASASPFLIFYLGGYETIIFAAILGILAVYAYAKAGNASLSIVKKPVWVMTLGLIIAAVIYPQWAIDNLGYDIQSRKDRSIREAVLNDFDGIESTFWSAVARMDISRTKESASDFLKFGLSSNAQDLEISGRIILMDGGAITRQFALDQHPADIDYLGEALWSLPYVINPAPERVLVIGAGGGIDVLVGKNRGAKNIDVAELNPITTRLLAGKLNEPHRERYARFLSSDDKTTVTIHNREARHFATTRDPGTYNVIQASGVDTLTAIASGGKALTENYLYTVDGVRELVRTLADGGVLSLTHWRQSRAGMTSLRMFATYLKFLEEEGVADPSQHIILVGGRYWNDAILRMQPFTKSELASIQAWADAAQFTVIHDPFRSTENDPGVRDHEAIYSQLAFASPAQRQQILDGLSISVDAVYDDRPFFYWFDRVTGPVSGFGGWPIFSMFVLASFGALALVVLPLLRSGRDRLTAQHFWFAGFFAISGFAFLVYEVALIQLLSVFVGGPIYTLAVVLVCVLIGYALGSILAGQLRARAAPFVITGLVLFGGFMLLRNYLPGLLISLMSLDMTGRIFVAGLISFITAISVAVPVTLAMSIVRDRYGSAVGWMWGVNSAFNVLGGISFVTLSLLMGIANVFLLVALMYLVACAGFASLTAAGNSSS